MLKDIFKIKDRVKGHILVRVREPGAEWRTVEDRKNAITANAPLLISKALAGETGWKIDRIECKKAGVQLAISNTTKTYPAPGEVMFETTFSTGSFNDTVDEVRLNSLVGGDFSTVTGLSITKTNLLELNIQWKLTII